MKSATRPLGLLYIMQASAQSGFEVSCSNASPYPVQTRSVARSQQALLVVYVLEQHSVVPGTINAAVVSCVKRTKSEILKSAGLRSHLQQRRVAS